MYNPKLPFVIEYVKVKEIVDEIKQAVATRHNIDPRHKRVYDDIMRTLHLAVQGIDLLNDIVNGMPPERIEESWELRKKSVDIYL